MPGGHRHRAGPRRSLWARRNRLIPGAAQFVIWTGAAAVLFLWWRDTPAVTGAAEWLTGAGRITGLLAGYACAVLLALMARLPVLDRGVGSDRLSRWHAMGGRYTVSLAIAHALLITLGYAMTAHTGPAQQAVTLITGYPQMLSCAAGFALLLFTAVVSARAARRRLSYEAWHALHFLTYLAIFLAFGHQLALGADFTSNAAARFCWYALYGTVAALLVWYRFLLPVRRALRHRLVATAVTHEAPGVVSIRIAGRHLDELGARPGQFFRWRFLVPGLWWSANPYSLSAPARDDLLRITVKAVGGHSARLARLRPGTRVWAEGPYGGLTAERATGAAKSLLVAGGVGITPLRALFETLPGQVTLIYRSHRPEDVVLRDELDAIARHRRGRVHYLLGDRADCEAALTARGLRRLVPELPGHDVYLCGPPALTETVTAALRRAGVPRRRIHHESFAF
ncbi:ferric reductase-like transmembrane domain-containing protein [Streptomyces xiamenensis]|uniref:ferredoxin reductase family protein n=1 Tax=Streptomyces xiamenensis TaxID=408015 RepID=UPI0036BC0BA2